MHYELHKSSFYQIIKFLISVRLTVPLEFNLELTHVSLGAQQCREVIQRSYRLVIFLHATAEQFVKKQELIIDTYCRCKVRHRFSLETSCEASILNRLQLITESLRFNGINLFIRPNTRILFLWNRTLFLWNRIFEL